MSAHNPSSAIAEELAKLEEICQRASQAIRSSRSVRETLEAAAVDVPHHLKAIASVEVPTLGRLAHMRDSRVEEVVKEQLSSLMLERNEFVASREFDRMKAVDWFALRAGYPDLYSKAMREANLIIERKRKRKD
jgi:ATP phosphoribosyltransferase